jgi:hypothetical protein
MVDDREVVFAAVAEDWRIEIDAARMPKPANQTMMRNAQGGGV